MAGKGRKAFKGTVATAQGKKSLKDAYRKEIRRIQNFIRRAEKRGYRFISGILPKVPKRITEGSIRRLQKITPDVLYGKSTALSEDGGIVSGLERRKEERSEASRKSAQTRKRRQEQSRRQAELKALNEKYDLKNRPSDPDEFQDWIRDRDAFHRKRLKMQEYRDTFNEGDMILRRVEEMIDSAGTEHPKSAELLKKVLDDEIATYGKDAVVASIAQAPEEIVEACEVALMYHPESGQHQEAIREMLHLIRGSIPTAEELTRLQEAMDSDEYEDFA